MDGAPCAGVPSEGQGSNSGGVFKSEFRNTTSATSSVPRASSSLSHARAAQRRGNRNGPAARPGLGVPNPGSGETGGRASTGLKSPRTRQRRQDPQPAHATRLRESVKVGEQNLYTRSKEFVGDRNCAREEFPVQMRDGLGQGGGPWAFLFWSPCGLGCSTRTREVERWSPGWNLGGSVELIQCEWIVELAIDGASATILMPVAAPPVERFAGTTCDEDQYRVHKDPADAVFKALVSDGAGSRFLLVALTSIWIALRLRGLERWRRAPPEQARGADPEEPRAEHGPVQKRSGRRWTSWSLQATPATADWPDFNTGPLPSG